MNSLVEGERQQKTRTWLGQELKITKSSLKETTLEIYDAMTESIHTGQLYQTRLDPSPADPRCCHLNKNA